MRILITGAGGFIGSRLVAALAARGHEVVCVQRASSRRGLPRGCARALHGDFARERRARDWLPRLEGVEVVVNAVGIFREGGAGETFEALHVDGPRALFEACVAAGVRRVVQLSALGADAGAATRYHRSKRAGDEVLLGLPLAAAVVAQPSLVHGAGGASAAAFTRLASLPLVPLPGRGAQRVQPIHVDDLVAALVALAQGPGDAWNARRVPLVGPRPLDVRDWLGELRLALGLPPARFVPVPMPLVRLAAVLGARFRGGLLDADSLAMLERGNVADASDTVRLLGHAPRPVRAFIGPDERAGALALARLGWLLPLLRVAVALLWIATGVVSLGLYPVDASLALLARVGIVDARVATLLLFGAALLDLGLGLATLLLARRRALYALQIALMLFYSAVIAWRLPEFWLHPFAPMLKNLPLLAALAVLLVLDR